MKSGIDDPGPLLAEIDDHDQGATLASQANPFLKIPIPLTHGRVPREHLYSIKYLTLIARREYHARHGTCPVR